MTVILVLTAMPVSIQAYDMGKVRVYQTISSGYGHTMAIKIDGSLWAWGDNKSGQLGDGTTKGRTTPVNVMDGVTAISVGDFSTMAIKADGDLWAWGANENGELGDGTNNDRSTPVKVMDGVTAVSAGNAHTMAIRTDGSLWAWGGNSWGQLGDGSNNDRTVPVKVMDGVIAVSAGNARTMAIKADGSLWAWGYNYGGRLGDGTEQNRATPIKVMDGVTDVSVGGLHAMAIKADGSLWAWGGNYDGELGDGSNNDRTVPVKVMDEVTAVSAGIIHTLAIKSDGSLWAWGSNGWGRLGDGTEEERTTPVKVMDGVAAVSAGHFHTLAIKTDGSLWAWGDNLLGQLGDDTTKSRTVPVKVMEGVKLPGGAKAPATAGYLYDSVDPAASLVLPTDKLDSVTDKTSAVSAIKSVAAGMSAEQKQSATGVDLITLYAEEAVAQAAGKVVSGSDIIIDQTSVQDLQAASVEAKAAAEQSLVSSGITTQREINADVKFKTGRSASVKITVDPSAVKAAADNVRVETPDYTVSFSASSIKANAGDSPLVITITENSSTGTSMMNLNPVMVASNDPYIGMAFITGNGSEANFTMLAAANTKTYNISFNKSVNENIKVSLPPASGDPTYQAVINSQGKAIGGKYNPVTKTLDVKLKDSDTYKVKENRKDFSDISAKSKEMQNAITILASKGIISGSSATTFSPDSPITRAEIAALITRTLSKYDANANGEFSDVYKHDWYYGAAGSAKKYGIMSGTSATLFAPKVTIPKDQITAVAARVLRIEMKYNNPANVNSVLNIYTDSSTLSEWSKTDLALATRENLVVKRSDGKFNPDTTMTRGDAAIILYRMFNKIW